MKNVVYIIITVLVSGCGLVNTYNSGANTGEQPKVPTARVTSGGGNRMNGIEECGTIMPTRTGEEIIGTDSLDYYYSKLGFGLQFPEERSGYIKKPDMSRFVYFSLNHRQMFYIYAQPLDAYKKHGLLRKEPLGLTYLGKNNKYMFYSTIYPVDYVWRHKPEYTPSIEMKERIAEVKSIIGTFYMNDI